MAAEILWSSAIYLALVSTREWCAQPPLRPHFVNWLHIICGTVCSQEVWPAKFDGGLCAETETCIEVSLSKTEHHLHNSCTTRYTRKYVYFHLPRALTQFSMQIEKRRRLNLQINLCAGIPFTCLSNSMIEIVESWSRHTVAGCPCQTCVCVCDERRKRFSISYEIRCFRDWYSESSDVGQ